MKNLINKYHLALAAVIILYLVSHLWGLTNLPVFADEAIYIRWTQLIIDDWQRYLFFPLNDGKTPLLMWMMAPFQLLFSDQLWAGRLVMVLVGLAQVLALGCLTKILGGRKKAVLMTMILVSVLPFWFFHHRMALTDGLVTLWLTLTAIGIVKLVQTKPTYQQKLGLKQLMDFSRRTPGQTWIWLIVAGGSLGLALWSKLPAILLLPALPFYALLLPKRSWLDRLITLGYIAVSVLFGLICFLSLKLNPAFGQLFSRGGDFLYPISEVLLAGKWQITLGNFPNYLLYFLSYLTTPIILLNLYAPFSPRMKRPQLVLLISAAALALPVMLFGIVVYPRYLFPASLFLTVSAVLALQEITDLWITNSSKLWLKAIVSIVLGLFLANILAKSAVFMTMSLTNSDQTPFVPADQVQYLNEWSSGHGIKQTVELIQSQSQDQTIAIATEGFFGTLPDGILMYLHRQNVDNIYVEGIGQPVREIPTSFATRAIDYDRVWLVVNSHRMQLKLPEENHLAQYCRPGTSPCLDVWDITELVQN